MIVIVAIILVKVRVLRVVSVVAETALTVIVVMAPVVGVMAMPGTPTKHHRPVVMTDVRGTHRARAALALVSRRLLTRCVTTPVLRRLRSLRTRTRTGYTPRDLWFVVRDVATARGPVWAVSSRGRSRPLTELTTLVQVEQESENNPKTKLEPPPKRDRVETISSHQL
jgi:hypothetical protein